VASKLGSGYSSVKKTHLPCPDCGSSDGLTDYGDSKHCFVCSEHTYLKEDKISTDNQDKASNSEVLDGLRSTGKAPDRGPKRLLPLGTDFRDMPDRGLSKATAEKYHVTKHPDSFYSWAYPMFSNGVHVSNKFRTAEKKGFSVDGDFNQSELFGQSVFPAGSSKQITLTEGYDDAMAAFEMQGSKYPCVSVHSASTAAHDVAKNFEYLNSFDEIVVCFDKDDAKIKPDGSASYPGQEAAVAVAGMFSLGKVRILTLSRAKDANDYLRQGLSKVFIDEWWKAPRYTPAGLKLPKNMWEAVSARKNSDSIPYPWDSLNGYTYGIRKSEWVLITAETGVGKTSVVKEIEWNILQKFLNGETTGKLGLLHLEEPNEDTLLGLMSISADKPLHLPDVRDTVAEEELKKYFDNTCNNDGMVIWDHFGSNSVDEVINKIRHMHNLGCDYVFFDHLSIVVSDQSGDERKQLDEISTKLKMLMMELDISVVGVIHQNRSGSIRGSAGPEQLANIVIKLSRDREDEDPWRRNITKLTIQKNRFSGKTGPCTYLEYLPETGRLVELTQEQVKQYESKTEAKVELW
jgi:twinkle protein